MDPVYWIEKLWEANFRSKIRSSKGLTVIISSGIYIQSKFKPGTAKKNYQLLLLRQELNLRLCDTIAMLWPSVL